MDSAFRVGSTPVIHAPDQVHDHQILSYQIVGYKLSHG